MIVVVIVGLLAAVAYPSFMDSIRKGRRSEAFQAITAVQQAQERWRANKSTYTTDLSLLGISSSTASGYYTISISAPQTGTGSLTNGYRITAAAVGGKSQASDANCSTVGLEMAGGNVRYAGGAGGADLTFTEQNVCWAR